MSSNPDNFDAAFAKILKELKSGNLYKKELKKIKQTGLNPDEPIDITFDNGTTITIKPSDSIKHLKPKK